MRTQISINARAFLNYFLKLKKNPVLSVGLWRLLKNVRTRPHSVEFRRCVMEALYRPNTYALCLNFKTYSFAYWAGASYIAVGMLLLYLRFSVALSYSFTHLRVVCCHFCCDMSLFQVHVACRNFTLTASPCN